MANFKGFKQLFVADFNALSNEEKRGYMWFVRENAEATEGAIYFGSRLYGNSTNVDLSNYYTKEEVDATLAEKVAQTEYDAKVEEINNALAEKANTNELSAIASLVEEVMSLIGLTVSEEAISLVLSESFEGAENVVAALELLATKLAEHEAAAEAKFTEIEGKISGLVINTAEKDGTTFVQLLSGEDVISEFDAAQFLIDGMLEDAILDGNMLILSFNTEAGKQDINVDLSTMIKSYVFNESHFVVSGESVALNEDYIKGLIAAAQSGLTVYAGKGIKVDYGTDENGGAVVTVSAEVDAEMEGNLLVAGDNGLYVVLAIDGNDVE
jgi:hypothetical protein